MQVTLRHGSTGLTLKYGGKVIARTYPSGPGRRIAPFIAQALGVELPPVGESLKAVVSSGVMYRVLSISTLDPGTEEGLLLLEYLLNEAREMRGFRSTAIE